MLQSMGLQESNTTEQLNNDNHVEEEMGVKRSLKTQDQPELRLACSVKPLKCLLSDFFLITFNLPLIIFQL